MTTNKPEVVMTLGGEQLIRLSDYEKLARYYKNGIDCFANPCKRHSGERTPPFSEFFEKYGGQCLICVVDNNRALKAGCEKLVEALELARRTLAMAALEGEVTRRIDSALAAHRKQGGEA